MNIPIQKTYRENLQLIFMFAAILERHKQADDRHSVMQQKHPRVVVEEPLAIAGFELPALKVTQGVAYCDNYGRIVEEIREDYFLCLSKIGESLGMPQCRFDHAWRRHRQKISDWDFRHRKQWTQLLSKHSSLNIHKVIDFEPMVYDIAPRRPYHQSLDAVYHELFPGDRLGRRRKS
ncbi:MAG: hypothetical protein PUP93_27225 [Rhizonema sp. NSF051]|nr:hypothetical protein [Rhizonema sp. NSF051]